MAVLFAGGAEAFYATANTSVDTLFCGAAAADVAERDTAWAEKTGDYAITTLINDGGETGGVYVVNGGPELAFTQLFASWAWALPSDWLAPLVDYVIVMMTNTFTITVDTTGVVELREGATVRDTWTPSLTADSTTKYWFLLEQDPAADTIRLHVGAADVSDPTLLGDPADWTGTPVLEYTGATGLTALSARIGPQQTGKNDADLGAAFLTDDIVFSDDKPVQPRLCYLLQLDGDGNYSGGSTVWTKSGGGAATYTVIDDTVTLTPDTTDFIIHPVPAGAGVQRVSFTLTSCAAAGMDSDAVPIAVLPIGWHRRVSGSASAASNHVYFLRHGGTDLDGNDTLRSANTAYSVAVNSTRWDVISTAPGGGAFTQAIIDAMELGIKHNDTSAILDARYEYAWLGLYVVVERPTPSAVTRRRMGQVV